MRAMMLSEPAPRRAARPAPCGFSTDDIIAAVLEALGHGVVVASDVGMAVYANRQARLCAVACGLRLGAHDGLWVPSPAETRQLRHLVRVACAGGEGGSVRLTAPDPSASLAARVSPLDVPPWPCAGALRGLALIVLRPLAPNAPVDTQRLMEMFGLTRAEAAILPALLAGDTTEAVATSLGLSTHTVRSHVRAVLAKTQTANLRALAALVSAVMAG